MVFRIWGRIGFIGLFSAFACAPHASGQENRDDRQSLARRIHQTVEAIQSIRLERLRLREQHQTELTEVERQIDRLKSDLDTVDAALKKERQRIDALEKTIRQNKKIKQTLERIIAQSAELFIPIINRIKSRIGAGIPYRKAERQKQLVQILQSLTNPSRRMQADALNGFLAFCAGELRLARSVNLLNEPVFMEGGKRRKHAYQIRLGLVNQFFISEDGRCIGLAAKQPGREWKLLLNRDQQQQLRAALDILQQKRPPDIIPIPFVIPSLSGSRDTTPIRYQSERNESED